jgi:hypothetical protein
MIDAHYRALVSGKDATAFFEVHPPGFKPAMISGNVVALETAGIASAATSVP